MKCLVFSVLSGVMLSFSAQAAEPMPIPRMTGHYTYQGNFDVPTIRRMELVPSQNTEGKARIKLLRKEGYNCFNKNPQVMRCMKSFHPEEEPAGVREALAKFLKGIDLQFYVGSSEPELVHDGVTTQEWYVYDKVRIGKAIVNLYRVSRTHEGNIFLSLPVSEDQPLGNLRYYGVDKLGFRLVSNVKESESVIYTYVIEPFFRQAP